MESGGEERGLAEAQVAREVPLGVAGIRGGWSSQSTEPHLDVHAAIYNAAYRLVGDESVAEQITQQVLSQEAHIPARWRRCRRIWLTRAMVALCERRQQGRPSLLRDRRRLPSRDAPATSLSLERCMAGSLATAFPEVPAGAIQDSLNRLPFDQRVAVVLSDVEGMCSEEIARATRVPVRIARSRLSSGRMALRDTLFGTPR